MKLKNIANLFQKDLKAARGWLIFVSIGIVLINLYIWLKLSSLAIPEMRDPLMLLSASVIFPIIILMFVRGISVLKSERDNRTLEYLKALPVSGFEIITSKALVLAIEALVYVFFFIVGFAINLNMDSNISMRPNGWSFIYLTAFVWLFTTMGLMLQAIGMSARRYGKIIGFLSFIAISWITNKLFEVLQPLIDKLPSVSVLFLSSETLGDNEQPVSLGILILFVVVSVIYAAAAGAIIENKMEV